MAKIKFRQGASFEEYCPFPVGTCLFCLYDPNAVWPGTTWERHDEGVYLVAAGGTYRTGGRYGENAHALAAAELPWHAHALLCNLASGSSMSGVEFFQGTGTSGRGFINDEENHRDDVPMAQNRPHNNMPLSVAVPLWERTG